jgi:site-specific DNA recombinase
MIETVDGILDAQDSVTCWGYVRVSTGQQADGYSPEAQIEDIQRYCAQNGLGDPAIVTEAATAAKDLFSFSAKGFDTSQATRPLFACLLSVLSQPAERPRHLVVYMLDRLSRQLTDQEMILRLLWNADVQTHSVQPQEQEALKDGGTDPQRALFRQILAAFKQYEAALITLRTHNGLRQKARKGGYTGGRVPFGYRVVDNELTVDQNKRKIVLVTFYLRSQGRTVRDIASIMNDSTFFQPKKKFHASLISRILSNEPLYRGLYVDRFGHSHERSDLRILPEPTTELSLYEAIND